MPEYRVQLERFCGPLDLLLYLIRSDELDVQSIPISRITDQYLSFLHTLEAIDIEAGGDFLVMAATLMEIKSRMLLPPDPSDLEDDEELDDPRTDLVRQLLQYREFRQRADWLAVLREETSRRFPRRGPTLADSAPEAEPPAIKATLFDLMAAFQRLMREVLASAPRTIVFDDTPLRTHMARVLEQLRGRTGAEFRSLFAGRRDRGYIIGTFIALLELAKLGCLLVHQEESSEEIQVRLVEGAEDAYAAAMESLGMEERALDVPGSPDGEGHPEREPAGETEGPEPARPGPEPQGEHT